MKKCYFNDDKWNGYRHIVKLEKLAILYTATENIFIMEQASNVIKLMFFLWLQSVLHLLAP